MTKSDRRIQRTRKLLQMALIELIAERGYYEITIRDIIDRANVGRTTFYLHYANKDELFISCHETILEEFHFGPLSPLSREELLSSEAPPGMTAAYRHLEATRPHLSHIFQGKDGLLILRRIRARAAEQTEASLRAAFAEADGSIPIEVLANYLAGAQIAILQWCLETRQPYKPESLAKMFHRLQRAAIRDAFGLRDVELKASDLETGEHATLVASA
jgi:AcrR family transcriptional regulator